MKRNLLLASIVILLSFSLKAKSFLVENYLGINCIQHTVQNNETLYKVAQRFFIRPSTLALVNNIEDVNEVVEGASLYIPLTETNFYNTQGLKNAEFTFSPIEYVLDQEKNWLALSELFFVSESNLKEWNKNSQSFAKGNRFIVGWLKNQTQLSEAATPRFVQKEKIIFGTSSEKIAARKSINNIKSESANPDFKDYTIPSDALPNTKSEVSFAERKKEIKKATKESKKLETIVAQKTEAKIKNVEAAHQDEKVVKITQAEKDFLKQKEKSLKPKRKTGFLARVKNLTQNSYARDKEKDLEKIAQNPKSKKIVKPQVTTSIQAKEEVKNVKPEVKKKGNEALGQKIENEEIISKEVESSTVAQKEVAGSEDENDEFDEDGKFESLYVENKMQRLTLLKSIKGRVAFFYSGTAGAKFYVFTNLAGKGSIIKLTNLENGKYILAEVIGLLPEVDRSQGYTVKLSDNSKRVLGTEGKSFSAKINY